jgi:hypothetical protein
LVSPVIGCSQAAHLHAVGADHYRRKVQVGDRADLTP